MGFHVITKRGAEAPLFMVEKRVIHCVAYIGADQETTYGRRRGDTTQIGVGDLFAVKPQISD